MKIVYETERVAKLKRVLKALDTKELEFLQEYIEVERSKRKKAVYADWLQYLDNFFHKCLH